MRSTVLSCGTTARPCGPSGCLHSWSTSVWCHATCASPLVRHPVSSVVCQRRCMPSDSPCSVWCWGCACQRACVMCPCCHLHADAPCLCCFCLAFAVAGVSFAWTVVISCMRGALDSMQQSAPTTAQIEEAVAQVAAAAAVTTTALAEPLPAGTAVTAASPAEPSGRGASAAAAPSAAAAVGDAAAAPAAAAQGPVLAAAHAPHGHAQAARAGFKALVPRPHVAAEATG